ncbi:hypothetical protein OUZ56_017564 [Daphnia magna]|uniref:Uncharacterized protein n=1 Tax=Daphnia magna TaxID=35525 RepID=A0ABR0AT38_9CRUS|nr:hypothetical protein OUZ56_017564 [Daphnia magna]
MGECISQSQYTFCSAVDRVKFRLMCQENVCTPANAYGGAVGVLCRVISRWSALVSNLTSCQYGSSANVVARQVDALVTSCGSVDIELLIVRVPAYYQKVGLSVKFISAIGAATVTT